MEARRKIFDALEAGRGGEGQEIDATQNSGREIEEQNCSRRYKSLGHYSR